MENFDYLEELKKELERITKFIDKEVSEATKEDDNFIISLADLARKAVNDKGFDEDCRKWEKDLLNKSAYYKHSFATSYKIALSDLIDDVIGLVVEHKRLSEGKRKPDEKSK